MIWLTWRQFRAQAVVGLAVLAAAAAYLLVTGVLMHHTYTDDLASCGPFNDCDSTLANFQQDWASTFQLAQLLVLVAPALTGIFWGARSEVSFALQIVALKALPVLILGGLTSVPGAIVGGLIIGVGEKLGEFYWGPLLGGGIESWLAYIIALAFLLVRPQGLFGERIFERV